MLRILVYLGFLTSIASAQEWKRFTVSNSGLVSDLVYDIAVAKNGIVWAGTGAGLASFNGTVWTTYDTLNSPLPDPYITALAADTNGVIWIGMGYAGVARLSNGVWTHFDSANSGLPHNTIFDIAIGPDNTPWFATERGVVNFNGSTWRNIAPIMVEPRSRAVAFDRRGVLWMGTYDAPDFRGYVEYLQGDSLWFTILSKLDIISTHPWCMAPLDDSTMFVGTGNGLAKVVNGRWTIYHKQDSPLPANGIRALASVGDTMLIGTASGYCELAGGTWNVVLPSAGGLPNDVITDIAVDGRGNRWLATASSGIVVHKPGGIVTQTSDHAGVPEEFALHQNFPNPFNPSTTFRFTLRDSGPVRLSLYDDIGREVSVLVNGVLAAGRLHERSFNASTLSSGIYLAVLQSGSERTARKIVLLK